MIVTEQRKIRRLGGELTPKEMARVTAADFFDIQRASRGYCRAVDATRSRKRMDGSATSAPGGRARYGTDDVSDDVTQDGVLIFAGRLHKIVSTCAVSAVWVATREPSAWQYVRRDGETIVVTRKTLQYWAVRDAAARNGYRLDVRPDSVDAQPGAQLMRGVPHADALAALAVSPYLAGQSEAIFRAAWGDGSGYYVLPLVLDNARQAEDLGRAGIMGKTAQQLYGGPRNSSSKVQRARDAALKEWRDLTAALDSARDDLVYRSTQRDA
jgi:hypothetical protein